MREIVSLRINGSVLTETEMRNRGRVLSLPGCDEAFSDFLSAWFDDSEVVVAHTSGSTGVPKRIELSKRSMRESARRTNAFFGLRRGDALLMCLSANYIAGKMMVVRALVGGLDLYVQPASSTPTVDRPYKLVSMVPMQVHALRQSGVGYSSMAYVENLLVGGSQLLPEEAAWLTSLPTKSFISYGMTETVSHVALSELPKEGAPLFEALPDVSFEQDDRGCLVIHADYLQGSPFVTNDVVDLLSDRSFRWLGRWDNVINTGGVKVFPEEMEKRVGDLIRFPFYFIGVQDAKYGQCVVLRIESEPFDTEDLLRKLSDRLTRYEMPKRVSFLPHFERTASGKVKRG